MYLQTRWEKEVKGLAWVWRYRKGRRGVYRVRLGKVRQERVGWDGRRRAWAYRARRGINGGWERERARENEGVMQTG